MWVGRYLPPAILDAAVGISMLAMAGWTLIPDKLDGDTNILSRGAFVTTLVAFFVAEIGDKTQIATLALAAGYSNLPAIVAGTTLGMMAANVPVVFLGAAFAKNLPEGEKYNFLAKPFTLKQLVGAIKETTGK